VARMTGKTATVFVPLTGAEAGRNTIRVHAFAKDDEPISVRVNDNKDVNGKLTKGWSTIDLAVPAGQLKEGENALSLFAKHDGLELGWMQIGATSAAPEDSASKIFDAGSKTLVIPKDGGMTWFVAVPEPGAKLAADVAPGCTINVVATADDGHAIEGKLPGA